MKSEHQLNVEAFMLRAKQEVPIVPTMPNAEVRALRARLILEEAFETIKALGVCVEATLPDGDMIVDGNEVEFKDLRLIASDDEHRWPSFEPNMIEVIDGVCDLSVVGIGTLSAMGCPDLPFIRAVDAANLRKFGPGHSWRGDGKLLKPPGFAPPDLESILEGLRAWPA